MACLKVLSAVVLALVLSLVSGSAIASDRIDVSPAPGYYFIDWKPGDIYALRVRPRVSSERTISLEQWLQVAPGGRALAVWSASSGLYVFAPSGAKLLRRRGELSAFRFSPDSSSIAVASAKGIQTISLPKGKTRLLAPLSGVDWLRWIDAGLLVRLRGRLIVIGDTGKRRILATLLPKDAVVATSAARTVFFSHGSLIDVDLTGADANGTTRLTGLDKVIDAEISRDGAKILFATAKHVYIIEGRAAPVKLADARNLRSLLFSPDGSEFLWYDGLGGGAIATSRKLTAIPPDPAFRDVRFRQDGGAGLVLTTADGAMIWDPTTGKKEKVGGLSLSDGGNIASDLVGGAAAVLCYTPTAQERADRRLIDSTISSPVTPDD
jgi:hypothetical protein